MEETFQYPPELFALMVDTLPLLCRSKDDLLLFFRGAGVSYDHLNDVQEQLQEDRKSINKYQIARTILARLNERGTSALGERRELLKRVVEFDDFSMCWPDDQLKAKGLVSEIRRVVDVKDSFTRMKMERNKEVDERRQKSAEQHRKTLEARQVKATIHQELAALFAVSDRSKRGKKLEGIMNRLFALDGLLIKEAFHVVGDDGEGIVEQIDGVIELDGHLYLVEMKWLAERRVDISDVSRHLVRIYHRSSTRGLFISYTEFTTAALSTCVEALQKTVISLCLLEEIVSLLEANRDLRSLLRKKINAAQLEKNPFVRILE